MHDGAIDLEVRVDLGVSVCHPCGSRSHCVGPRVIRVDLGVPRVGPRVVCVDLVCVDGNRIPNIKHLH